MHSSDLATIFQLYVLNLSHYLHRAKRGRDCIKPLIGLDNIVLRPGVKEEKYMLQMETLALN